MNRYEYLAFLLALVAVQVRCAPNDSSTVDEGTSKAGETDETGASATGAVARRIRNPALALIELRRWVERDLKSRSWWAVGGKNNETPPPDLTPHTHPPLGLTRDPFCNMTAFVKLKRDCWKATAVYSSEPGGICSLKASSLFRRCLVRASTATSCSDDERALGKIRHEVDALRAQCAGVPMRRNDAGPRPGLPRTARFHGAFGLMGPAMLVIVLGSLH